MAYEADAEIPYEPYNRSPSIPLVLQKAIADGKIDEDNDPLALFIDLDRIKSKVTFVGAASHTMCCTRSRSRSERPREKVGLGCIASRAAHRRTSPFPFVCLVCP